MTEQKGWHRARDENCTTRTTDVYWVGVGGGFPAYLLWDKLHHIKTGKSGYIL